MVKQLTKGHRTRRRARRSAAKQTNVHVVSAPIQKVQIGEVIPMMVEEMEKGLLACISKNQHRREAYWILYTANWYKNGEQLRTTFTPFPQCPPRLLNTMCWKIDNVAGRCEEVWILPLDAPIQPVKTDGIIESIAEAAQGMRSEEHTSELQSR